MENVSIRSGKKPVSRFGYVKFLGLLMDENLSWKYHFTELAKKQSRTSGIFLKIRNFLPLDILKNLHYSIFSSFLSYASSTWGLSYDTYLETLCIVQKKVGGFFLSNHCISFSTNICFTENTQTQGYDSSGYSKNFFISLNHLPTSHFHNCSQLNSTVHFYGTRQAVGRHFPILKEYIFIWSQINKAFLC